jgi:hypothetical protein
MVKLWPLRRRRTGVVVSAWEQSTNYQLVREHLVDHGVISSEDLARRLCAFAAGSTPDLRASGRKIAEKLVDARLLSRTGHPDRWALPPLPADVAASAPLDVAPSDDLPADLPGRRRPDYETHPELYDTDPRFVEVRRTSEADELGPIARMQLGHYTVGATPPNHRGWTIADVVWVPSEEVDGAAAHWIVVGADGGEFVFVHYGGLTEVRCPTFALALTKATARVQDEYARGLRT